MRTLTRQGAFSVLLLAATTLLPIQLRAQESVESARKVLIKTPPMYPTLARSMNIHGVVKVEAQVLPNGTVKNVDVKGGHPLLTQSAVTAVGHWKFEPAAHETKELVELKFDPQ
jgi:TonB family protein